METEIKKIWKIDELYGLVDHILLIKILQAVKFIKTIRFLY